MKKIILLLIALTAGYGVMAAISVDQLRTEHMSEPYGIEEQKPMLSWILGDDSRRGVSQSAYQIVVKNKGRTVWDTGKVISAESTGVLYDGLPLVSNNRYQWQVRVWDDRDKVSKWSQPARWHTGLLDRNEWKASWIEPMESDENAACFRKSFRLSKPVTEAMIYITAHGIYEANINGRRVSADLLTPGWTAYQKRLQYQVYDVTPLLKQGENAIGVCVAKGWYLSMLPFTRASSYGDSYGLLSQIIVRYADGSVEVVATDGTWRCSTAEVSYDNLYDGETLDMNKRQKGWDAPGFDAAEWKPVRVADTALDNLTASVSPGVRVIATLKPVKYIVTPGGDKVIDFGQNVSGRERVRLRGQKGDTIRIHHAEVLDENGEFYTHNLRSAKALTTFILSGDEQGEWYSPRFAFYGFRYIRVEGMEGDLNPDDFVAEAISSDLPETGTFSTSDPDINRLQSNIVWGMVGNFIDIPTDCPQRDERLGWTGDAQIFFRTAAFNRDVQTFFSKWLADLEADQREDGAVWGVVPTVYRSRISAGWGDAATIIPWQHYMAYGDIRILQRQYDSMKGWVDYITSQTERDLWSGGRSYGDWVFFSYTDDRDGRSAVTIRPMIQQCFYAHSLDILARTASLLGKKEDAGFYKKLWELAVEAYRNEYVTPNGMIMSDTQTAYTLALMFDLLPEDQRPEAARRLAENINHYGHITTGFLGTPYICHVLSEHGYLDLAYKLLLNKKIPSWLYPISMGATTIWERWSSMLPDGSIPDNGMNSFNHYAYGSIGDWLYREAVGLREAEPGYKRIIVRPKTGEHFTGMKSRQKTPYGNAAVEWIRDADVFTLRVTVPVNSTADIYVPCGSSDVLSESGRALTGRNDIEVGEWEDGYAMVKVGSGNYEFTVNKK